MLTALLTAFLAAPGLTVTWDPVTKDIDGAPANVVAYEVSIFDVSGARVTQDTGTSLSRTYTSPAFSTGTWRVEVRAINNAGMKSAPAVVTFTVPSDAVPPEQPLNLRVGVTQ